MTRAAEEWERRNGFPPSEAGGLRQTRFARSTGALVSVYDGIASGIEADDPAARWLTICEDHRALVGHSTLALARVHASDPEGWCAECRDGP